MRASAILLLCWAFAFTAAPPSTHGLRGSFAAPTSALLAKNTPTAPVAGNDADTCTPVSGPHLRPSNAVGRAEPFGGRASVAMRGAFGVAEVETPTAADLSVRGLNATAHAGLCLHVQSDRIIHRTNTRITSVNRRWLVYASALALRRAGLLSARSTAPAPPVSPRA